MLTTIHITVRDRVPTITAGEDVVSHNSDYVAEFEFDEEWQDKVKTVYFVCEDGSYQAVVMSGNSCDVPMMAGEHRRIFVGVQAGSAEKPSVLKTTRPCCLKVKDSIADYLGQPIPDPTPDVYEQIIAMLNNLTTPTWDAVKNKPFSTLGGGLSVDENGVLSAQGGGGSPNAVQYVAQTLTDEQKTQARENIGAVTSSFSGSYNDLTSKPTIPTQVTIDSTLKQSGQAADAKAVGDALGTKLDKNQGTGNAGKILGIGEDGIVVPQDKPSGGTVTVDSELSATSENPVQNKVVTAALAEKITAPATASVGQIIKVKSVDGTGKPTEWEAADMPSGGGKEEPTINNLLCETVFPANNVAAQEITCDVTCAQLAQYKELHFIIRGANNTSIPNLYLSVAGINDALLIRMTAAGFYGIVRRDFENSNLVRAWMGTSNPSLIPDSPTESKTYLYNTFTVGMQPKILNWTKIFAAADKKLILKCSSAPTIDYTLKIYGIVAMT